MKDLKEIKAGDILPLEMPDYGVMFAADIPCFKVKLGVSNERYALKVLETLVLQDPTKR